MISDIENHSWNFDPQPRCFRNRKRWFPGLTAAQVDILWCMLRSAISTAGGPKHRGKALTIAFEMPWSWLPYPCDTLYKALNCKNGRLVKGGWIRVVKAPRKGSSTARGLYQFTPGFRKVVWEAAEFYVRKAAENRPSEIGERTECSGPPENGGAASENRMTPPPKTEGQDLRKTDDVGDGFLKDFTKERAAATAAVPTLDEFLKAFEDYHRRPAYPNKWARKFIIETVLPALVKAEIPIEEIVGYVDPANINSIERDFDSVLGRWRQKKDEGIDRGWQGY